MSTVSVPGIGTIEEYKRYIKESGGGAAMLQIINYALVCGVLLFIMSGLDRGLLTYALFSKDILPGLELAIEASNGISFEEEQRAIENTHQRNNQVKRASDEGRRSFRVAWISAIVVLIPSILASLTFSSELLLKTILGVGVGMVVISLGIMLLKYRKVSRLIGIMIRESTI